MLAAAALLAAGLGACGSSDSESTGSSKATAPAADSTAATTTEDQDGAGASFRTPGGDNSIQSFGEEADAAEVDAATAVLSGYMRARAENDWAGECAYLAKATVAPLEGLASRTPQSKGQGCATTLESLTGGVPSSTRANTMTGAIGSLRVEGDRGFALYHGPNGSDYFVPMVKEDGEWKVGALAPSEFP